jgi:hypothetical protein
MKRIIRLTESDLTRIVRRVIREQEDEWSDEEDKEYKELHHSGHPHLNDYGDDFDRFSADAETFRNKRDSNPRYQELRSKKMGIHRKKEEDRYNDVVSNRPEDYDTDAYNDEYNDLARKIVDREKSFPRLQKGEDAMAFSNKLKKYTEDPEFRSMKNRAVELKRALDKDYDMGRDFERFYQDRKNK